MSAVTVTVEVNDITVLGGTAPAEGAAVTVAPWSAEFGPAAILSTRALTIPLENGSGSFGLEVARFYSVQVRRVEGLVYSVWVVKAPDEATVTLSSLLLNHSVDPETITPLEPKPPTVTDVLQRAEDAVLESETASLAAGEKAFNAGASAAAALGHANTALGHANTAQGWAAAAQATAQGIPATVAPIMTSIAGDYDSAFAEQLRKFPIRDSDGTPYSIDDADVAGFPGWWNMIFKHTAGYGFHFTTGAGFAAPAIMAFGTDTTNAVGMLFSNKGNGSRGVIFDQFNTAGAPVAGGSPLPANASSPVVLVRQYSIYSPAVVMTSALANSKPVLSFRTGTWGNDRHVLVNHTDNSAEANTYWEVMAKDGRHFLYSDWHFGGSKANDVPGLTMRYATDTSLSIYRTAGGGLYYPFKIFTDTDELVIGSGIAQAAVDGTETIGKAIRISRSAGGTKLGFFGVAAALRPAALVQTYADTSRTLAGYVPDTEAAAYTGTPADAASTAKLADLNALRVAYENLRAHHESLAKFVNSIVDDLQTIGLEQ